MKPLYVYWNDLSLHGEIVEGELGKDGPWALRAQFAFDALLQVLHLQSKARVSIAKGHLHAELLNRTLLPWLELWLGRDKLRWFKSRIVQPLDLDEPPLHELFAEVTVDKKYGEGITRAHISRSWVWSLGFEVTKSHAATIPATELTLDESGEENRIDILVSNLATMEHAKHWEDTLSSWGIDGADNCIIGDVSGNQILMYPLDHGYPHIHVKYSVAPERSIKYRVDEFEALTTSPADLDVLISPWVEKNLEILLESWRRCKKGLHPLKIQNE